MTPDMPIAAFVVIDSWAGRRVYAVDVIGYTPKKWRVRAREDMRLAGRCRELKRGAVALVPRGAVIFGPAAAVPS